MPFSLSSFDFSFACVKGHTILDCDFSSIYLLRDLLTPFVPSNLFESSALSPLESRHWINIFRTKWSSSAASVWIMIVLIFLLFFDPSSTKKKWKRKFHLSRFLISFFIYFTTPVLDRKWIGFFSSPLLPSLLARSREIVKPFLWAPRIPWKTSFPENVCTYPCVLAFPI